MHHNKKRVYKKITNDDTMTWKKFKQQRYELMENSLDTIPYIDADKLVQDYVDALKVDASNEDRNVTVSTNVRRINYHYLKRVTNDFREAVLTGKNDVIHISTPEEFKEKIMQNKIENVNGNTNYYIGNFVLDNDIDLSQIQVDGDTIIDGYFMGKLNGNGYRLIGNKAPIFNNIKFANISNLIIEDSEIVVIDQSNEKTGSLAKIVEYSTLESITGKNINVSAYRETGSLVGNITGAIVKDTHVIGVTVSGTARVGAMAGYVDKSQMMECSANGETSATEAAVGGFVGEIVNESIIKDCYSIGTAKGNADVGGFIGYVNKSSIINCFSNAKAEGNAGIASFVGQTHNKSTLRNNLTLVNQFKGYKFDGRTGEGKFENFSGNYENAGNAGTSTRDRLKSINLDGKIDIASASAVETVDFYTNTLGWDEEIWDFSKVSTGGIPKLKNSDQNDNSFAAATYHIKSADEFIEKITADPYGRFILDNNIDFSSEDSIIDVEFRGRLECNNNKLTGNRVPIFEVINTAKINGLIIEGSKISVSGDYVGVLASSAINSEIENVHVTEATITKADNKVGGIVGTAENSTLKVSSSNVVIMANGNDVGGLVGEIKASTTIENCYSIGQVQGIENIGGLVGNVAASTIRNSYSSTSADGIDGAAGFIGQSTENSTIANNINLGNQIRQYKFDGRTEYDKFVNYSNNFEYKENRGNSISSRTGISFDGIINEATTQQITDKAFYTTTLGWDEQIWDLSNVSNKVTPKLQGLDPNANKAVGVHKADIYSVDDFISELSAHPDGEFTIMNDLDFVNKSYNVGTVLISGVFDGVIKGNGHTIKNLKNATIFEQFNGEVDNLNVDKFDYGAVYYTGVNAQYVASGQSDRSQSNIAVFAKKSLNAAYSNMKFSKITIFGHDNVAVVVSVDNNSTFENINVSHASVNAGKDNNQGNNISTFISEKTGGLIKNCYVHGEIFNKGKNSGGIVGIAHGNVTIENVISNIYLSNSSITTSTKETSGLFAGELSAETVIKNSAAIGLTKVKEVKKFAGTIKDISKIENCYESSSSSGTSNANGSNIIAATITQLKDKNFYINALGFDENIWALDNIVERYYTESVNAHGQVDSAFPKMLFFGLK